MDTKNFPLGFILFVVLYNVFFGIDTLQYLVSLAPNFTNTYKSKIGMLIYLALIGIFWKLWIKYIKY